MVRSNVVIRDEPASIRLGVAIIMIGVGLRSLIGMNFTSVSQGASGSSINITSMNLNTLPATYFANFSSETVSLGSDPF